MKITRLGHANVLLEGSKNIIIDPFFTGNPTAARRIDEIPKLDLVLVTHDHDDHFGQAIELAKRDNATLIAIHEVTLRDDVANSGIQAVGMNIGGTYALDGVTVSMAPAVHSALHGNSASFVVHMDDKTVYHAGDTALFNDMQLIPQLFGALDVALLPIGGHFTMDEPAAAAAVALLKLRAVIPIHYNTWPLIQADTEKFTELCKGRTKVVILEPGQSYQVE